MRRLCLAASILAQGAMIPMCIASPIHASAAEAKTVAIPGNASLKALSPMADPRAVVVSGNARFTVLTPQMIRIEYSDEARFEDRATFAIQNRRMTSVPDFSTSEDEEYLYISTSDLKLKYRKGSNPKVVPASPDNLSITLRGDGEDTVWYLGKPDPLNLKGTCRTLDGSIGDNKRSELENGLLSRSGWSVIDDSWSATRPDGSRSFAMEENADLGYQWWADRHDPNALDLYFLGYGHDYKKALYDFTCIAGKIPLPPDYVFGYWYSRYASYSADDYRAIMDELERNQIPTDVMILDMDWHWNGNGESLSEGRGAWTGWSWNTNLIPDPKGLLKEMHDRDFHLSLNLHPADGVDAYESPEYFAAMKSDLNGKYTSERNIGWNLDYPDFTKSFFSNIIRDHENTGVDFWWLDWQQHLTSHTTPGLGETFWCNHVFYNDMAHNRPDRRPVIFHRWGGLGSHRYQIGFSGDAYINFPTLAFQPYFTATASNVGYTYWGHDLGGHMYTDEATVNDPELMLRWIQYGVFSPIFRSHATKESRIERRIWKFPNFPTLLEAVRLRYSLFPYIYTMARKTYDTGIGICRPMYYDSPEAAEAYSHEGQYMFGDNILVAPIVEKSLDGKSCSKQIWLPEGKWWSMASSQLLEGPCTVSMEFSTTDIPYFYRAGSMIPLYPESVKRVTDRPVAMILDIVAGADGDGSLYEDSGDNSDYDTSYAYTTLTHRVDNKKETYRISARQGVQTELTQRRQWTLRIHNADMPKKISCDGKKIRSKGYTYDAASRLLTVSLPEAGCDAERTLHVEYR